MNEEIKEYTNEDSTIYALENQIGWLEIISNYGGKIHITGKEHQLVKVFLEKLLSNRKFDEKGYLVEEKRERKI